VKLTAKISGIEILRGLARLEDALANAALDAATDALVREAERARTAAGLAGSIERDGTARRRLIGSRDPAAVARELGTLERPPAPWLAPVLPAVRATLRAAALQAVARAISRIAT
jgi:hypothetical protein